MLRLELTHETNFQHFQVFQMIQLLSEIKYLPTNQLQMNPTTNQLNYIKDSNYTESFSRFL